MFLLEKKFKALDIEIEGHYLVQWSAQLDRNRIGRSIGLRRPNLRRPIRSRSDPKQISDVPTPDLANIIGEIFFWARSLATHEINFKILTCLF
jgi:hypothetical protein